MAQLENNKQQEAAGTETGREQRQGRTTESQGRLESEGLGTGGSGISDDELASLADTPCSFAIEHLDRAVTGGLASGLVHATSEAMIRDQAAREASNPEKVETPSRTLLDRAVNFGLASGFIHAASEAIKGDKAANDIATANQFFDAIEEQQQTAKRGEGVMPSREELNALRKFRESVSFANEFSTRQTAGSQTEEK